MTQNDPLASVLSSIENYERLGRKSLRMHANSAIIKEVLLIMKDRGYVGGVETTTDTKGDVIVINLLGTINRVGVIKPRFAVKANEFEKWERRFLPARGFGILIVSTTSGVMTNLDAREKKLGGRLISFCY